MQALLKHPTLALGFRPFFLLAALMVAGWMPLWIFAYSSGLPVGGYLGGLVWHGHEMLFGFTSAVIAGFFLTAVPNWTGVPGHKEGVLAALVVLWLAGRGAVLAAGHLPAAVVIAVDVAFLPAVALAILPALLKSKNWRNIWFPPLLTLGAGANLLVHLGALGIVPNGVELGLNLGIDMAVLVIVTIGGRVVPFFTTNAVRMPSRPVGLIDKLAVWSMIAVLIVDLIPISGPQSGILALAAAGLNLWRMVGWNATKTLDRPILWVLHLGYLWVAVGLGLKGLAALTDWVPWALAVHGLTAGAIGTFTLGMMSRVALGHTGRMLEIKPVMVIAYLLVSLGAGLRVLAPLMAPHLTRLVGVELGGICWSLGFVLFLAVYGPILTTARPDGRPG